MNMNSPWKIVLILRTLLAERTTKNQEKILCSTEIARSYNLKHYDSMHLEYVHCDLRLGKKKRSLVLAHIISLAI